MFTTTRKVYNLALRVSNICTRGVLWHVTLHASLLHVSIKAQCTQNGLQNWYETPWMYVSYYCVLLISIGIQTHVRITMYMYKYLVNKAAQVFKQIRVATCLCRCICGDPRVLHLRLYTTLDDWHACCCRHSRVSTWRAGNHLLRWRQLQ